jgi:hypothetical protein
MSTLACRAASTRSSRIVTGIGLAALAALLVICTQAIMARAFGWTSFAAGLLTELAIEPLPFGNHSLVSIDWSAMNAPEGILHSWTYSHPEAVRHIKEWVAATLKGSSLAND